MKLQHYNLQKDDPNHRWQLPEDFTVSHVDAQGELVVAGVYIRLFIANAGTFVKKLSFFSVLYIYVCFLLTLFQHGCYVDRNSF